MASFTPTKYAMLDLARLTGREADNPMVAELFDVLVLRGHLTPFLPDWWEQIRWGEVAEIAAAWRKSCS